MQGEEEEWENLRTQLVDFAATLAPAIYEFRTLAQRLAPHLDQVARAVDAFPARQREVLNRLAQDGWYLDPAIQMPTLFRIEAAFSRGELDAARGVLCRHFNGRINEIEERLVGRFSARARPIHAAIEAHRRKEFELSIPVFLAQADGVCGDLYGVQLYARQGDELAGKLKAGEQTELMSSLLHPLVTPAPITANAKERKRAREPIFNRHAILHGEDSAYGTEINSCRALSHLNFVAWVLEKRKGTTEDVGSPS